MLDVQRVILISLRHQIVFIVMGVHTYIKMVIQHEASNIRAFSTRTGNVEA